MPLKTLERLEIHRRFKASQEIQLQIELEIDVGQQENQEVFIEFWLM